MDLETNVDIRDEVLEIDLHNLTEALQNHTAWFDHYTQNLPELKRAQMESKEEHARIGHELYLAYKMNPPEGIKVTDATLAALVATDQKYIDAHKRMMEIKQDHDSVERFRDLFERREKALTMLVQLYRGQYWGAHIPQDDPDEARTSRPAPPSSPAPAPRSALAHEVGEAELSEVKDQLAARAAESRKGWNKASRSTGTAGFRRG